VQAMLDLTPAGKPPAFDTHRPAMRAEYVSI